MNVLRRRSSRCANLSAQTVKGPADGRTICRHRAYIGHGVWTRPIGDYRDLQVSAAAKLLRAATCVVQVSTGRLKTWERKTWHQNACFLARFPPARFQLPPVNVRKLMAAGCRAAGLLRAEWDASSVRHRRGRARHLPA